MAQPDDEVFDTKLPGGGVMYMARRIDRKQPNGKYKKLLLGLGAGGFAVTLDGYRIVSGQRIPVAIKHVSMNPKAAEAFEKYEMRGIESMSNRVHPNLVRFIGYFKGDDGEGNMRLNFVFERCPTAVPYPLETFTTARGFVVPAVETESPFAFACDLVSNPNFLPPFHPVESRFIIRQLLSALNYLHSSLPPIIHRDVKPSNVLIWGSKVDPVTNLRLLEVKLTDYGTVRRVDSRDLTVGQGTKSFMAPEVDVQTSTGKNSKPLGSYGTSVDVFSAGATFFYLITGETPDSNTRRNWQERFGGNIILERTTYNGEPAIFLPHDAILNAAVEESRSRGASVFEYAAMKQRQVSIRELPVSMSTPDKPPRMGSGSTVTASEIAESYAYKSLTSTPQFSPALPGSAEEQSVPSLNIGESAVPSDSESDKSTSGASFYGPIRLNKQGDIYTLSHARARGLLDFSDPDAPPPSLLDFFFPVNSPQRLVLEGLVHHLPGLAPSTATSYSQPTGAVQAAAAPNTQLPAAPGGAVASAEILSPHGALDTLAESEEEADVEGEDGAIKNTNKVGTEAQNSPAKSDDKANLKLPHPGMNGSLPRRWSAAEALDWMSQYWS